MRLVDESDTRRLTIEEREQILRDFREDAQHMNGLHGAFFTPRGLARDFAIEVNGGASDDITILDLCAGIGALSYFCSGPGRQHVCVELNPDYVRVGRAVMPDAVWVCADAFDVSQYLQLGPFGWVISNPPFGAVPSPRIGKWSGADFELRLIEHASMLAPLGTFIVPQGSAPFTYSGRGEFLKVAADHKANKFQEVTGIRLESNCGIDTAQYRGDWHGVAPIVEVVVCEFENQPVHIVPEPEQLSLGGF
jgi:predicted RNA methylase